MTKAETTIDQTLAAGGYSHRFAAAVKRLLRIEGGWSNDPVDRGGATKFGISLRFLKAEGARDLDGDGCKDFDLDMDGDIDGRDVRLLNVADAIALYHRCFWQRLSAESWPAPVGEMLFDQAVNGGLLPAQKLLQRAINWLIMETRVGTRPALLKVDGQLGAKTRSALDWVVTHPGKGVAMLAAAYRDAVKERYRAIVRAAPDQQRFLKGWLNRAEELGR